jgi:hypothetical protein
MGGACSTDGRNEKRRQYFGWKTLKVRDHMENLGVDGKTTLECILGK